MTWIRMSLIYETCINLTLSICYSMIKFKCKKRSMINIPIELS